MIGAAALASSIFTEAQQDDQANAAQSSSASQGQVVVEAGAQPSPEELEAAEYLAKQGHRVRLVRRDPASPLPQPDAQLDDDDFPTEIKTVGNLTGSELDARLAGRIREALGQAPSVLVDARKQAGLDASRIESAMRRAYGMAEKTGKPIKRIRVLGPHGEDIVWDYTKKP